ncbi:MAG: PPOX class F420-dependent oxidoreductase, partial [Acidimicrobiia bacterium]|nr:PPOX class F420-dependent oxidoreductase [Acidimicrobiia bacterium]
GPYTDEVKPLVELMLQKRVAVRVEVDRVRSWDHRKLGLDPIPLDGSTARYLERLPPA